MSETKFITFYKDTANIEGHRYARVDGPIYSCGVCDIMANHHGLACGVCPTRGNGSAWYYVSENAKQDTKVDLDKTDKTEEYTGGHTNYYVVEVSKPAKPVPPYMAECGDIIEALGMDFAEGCAFKAIWRKAAARKLGVVKKGYDDGLYDAEKVAFYGGRMIEIAKQKRANQ